MTLLGDFCEVATFDVQAVGPDLYVAREPRT
jgi:hypothetical protein